MRAALAIPPYGSFCAPEKAPDELSAFRRPTPGAPLIPDSRELNTVRGLLKLCAEEVPFARGAAAERQGHREAPGRVATGERLLLLARA